jgi:seryl-tRNA(Sec) selenium transferase
VEMASINGYVGFETSGYHTLGRPMKVDRQEIAGCVVALREWLAMDHEARFATYGGRINLILREVKGLPGVEAYRISEHETPTPMVRDGVRLCLDSPQRAEAAVMALREAEPCIWVRVDDLQRDCINLSVAFLQDGDAELIARRLREALSVQE